MLAIQMNIFMIILLSSIAVHACYKLDRKEQVNRLFLALIFSTILILILEILSVLLNSSNYISFIIAHKLVNTLGFTLAPVVPICIVLYVYRRTNKYQKMNINQVLWLSVPLTLNSIISLGSYNFNWIFGITNENIYIRGPLFFVSPMTSYIYYMINLLFLYKAREKLNREELLILSLLTMLPSLLSIFQLYYFVYLTIWNSVAIAVVINYVFIIHSQTKIDSLTGLGNRIAYDEYLTILCRRSNIVLAVINIDLDNFKSINDVFGHHEGDRVLRVFAKQLEAVFEGKGVSIRLGGDEFIVLINENQREIVEKYIKMLNDNINAYNASSKMPYRIKFSYGMAIFNNTYNSIHELIQHSDKLMYEEKKKRTEEISKANVIVEC
ncbi:GGDEF domain-containing protein [Sporomusa malonica]|uniref:Diguanylate cyclase (GGDEF) domain-containing protein n=1 Tax=Sporomusa malonica TaxID=112901 RepID=A0A1W1ZL05_9FIRM|nr:GGDEF domain-containing protein [Sporomusa malonica]SMC48731.1 diguanylate cyclase (GGDEF) domain-containing protein [Sporomusa malonica]